eukprot:5626049-Prymnesium_polylepis.2
MFEPTSRYTCRQPCVRKSSVMRASSSRLCAATASRIAVEGARAPRAQSTRSAATPRRFISAGRGHAVAHTHALLLTHSQPVTH